MIKCMTGSRIIAMKPLCLAISIEWDDCTVAIAGGGVPSLELSAKALLAATEGAQASRDALSLVQRVLQQAGQPLSAVSAFYFNCGPGAFTSLRIAAGLVQGLALPGRRPVGAIGSLQALAATVPAWRDDAAGGVTQPGWLLCSALDARMGECYYAAYWCRPGCWPETWLQPAVGSPEQAAEAFEQLWRARGQATGVGLELAGGAFADFEALRDWALQRGADPTVAAGRRPSAAAVLALGAAQGAPAPGPAREAQPVYVRNRVALDRDEQRQAALARAAERQRAATQPLPGR